VGQRVKGKKGNSGNRGIGIEEGIKRKGKEGKAARRKGKGNGKT